MLPALSHSEDARMASLRAGTPPLTSSTAVVGGGGEAKSKSRRSSKRRMDSTISSRASSPSVPPTTPRAATVPLLSSSSTTAAAAVTTTVTTTKGSGSSFDDFWRYFQDASQLSFVMSAATSGQYSVIGLFEARSLIANFRSVDVSLVNRDDKGLKYIRGRTVSELRKFFAGTDFNSKSGLQIIHDLTLGGDISLSDSDKSTVLSAVKRRTQLLQIQRQKMDEHMKFHSPRDTLLLDQEEEEDEQYQQYRYRRSLSTRRSHTTGARSGVLPPPPIIPSVLTTAPLPIAGKLTLAPPSSAVRSPSYSPMLSPLTPLVWSGDTPVGADSSSGDSLTGHFPSITPLTVMAKSPDGTITSSSASISPEPAQMVSASENSSKKQQRRSDRIRKPSVLSEQISAAVRTAESVAVAMASGIPTAIVAQRMSATGTTSTATAIATSAAAAAVTSLITDGSSPNSSPIASSGFVTLDTPISTSHISPRLSAVDEYDCLEISVSEGHSSVKSAIIHEDGYEFVQYPMSDHYQQSASLSREYTVFSALSGSWETSRSGSLSVPRPPRSAKKSTQNGSSGESTRHLRITPIHSGTSTGSFSSTARTMSISSNWTLEEKEMQPSQPTFDSTAFKFPPRYGTVLAESETLDVMETPVEDELDYALSAPMTRRRAGTDTSSAMSSDARGSSTATMNQSWRMSESSTSRPTTQSSRHSMSHSRMATVVKSLDMIESEDASELLGYSTDEDKDLDFGSGQNTDLSADFSSSYLTGFDGGLAMASIPESSGSSSAGGSFSTTSLTASVIKSSLFEDEEEDEHKSAASEVDSSPMLTEHSSLSTSGMRTPVPTTPFKLSGSGSVDSNHSGGYTAGFGVIHRDSAGFNFRPGRSALSEEESPSLDVSPTLVLARIESGKLQKKKKKRESKRLSAKIRSKALKKVRSAGEVLTKKKSPGKGRVSAADVLFDSSTVTSSSSDPPITSEKTGLRLCYSARGTAGERPMDDDVRPKPLDLTWRLASLMQAPIGI